MRTRAGEIVGGWSLVHCSVEWAGKTSRPLGDRPGGMLLYTPDGWMSALLTSDPAVAGRATAQAESVTEAGVSGGTVAYAGRWSEARTGRCGITSPRATTGHGWESPWSAPSTADRTSWC